MIGRIRGVIAAKKPPELLIDIGGLHYEVQAPMTTFYHLPEIGEQTLLYTHLVVREDAHLLYGFYAERERNLFRSLIRVNGVGPKLALTILSGMEAETFVMCVQNEDSASLTSIPGIGRKTAERLIIETKDALAKWQLSDSNDTAQHISPASQANNDALSALTALGYKPNEAKRALSKVKQDDLNSEQLIRLALQQMVKGVSA